MLYGVVDLSGLAPLLDSLVNTLAGVDPTIAGVGAVVLLIVQRMGGSKFDVLGLFKAIAAKLAPKRVDVLGIPADLDAAELEVLKVVVDKIKVARGERVQAETDTKREGLLKRIFG